MTDISHIEMQPDGVATVVYAPDPWNNVARIGRDPGSDISDLPADMQAEIAAVWTPDFLAAKATAAAQQQALAAIQARRAQAILAWSYGGHAVPLSDQTQQDLGNAVQALARQPAGTTIQWEIADGVFVPLDLAALQSMGDAAFAHVQACFANSAALTAAAQAGQPYDLNAGWPA